MLEIKLEAFEGPLDLLYKLIEKNEINIYDIPIAKLTDQYIAYINTFNKDMESISEFLLMAATLIEIKFKMLLPKDPKKEEHQEDPREELVKKLIEYKSFKSIAEVFKQQATFSEKALHKLPEDEIITMLENNSSIDIKDTLEDITIHKLFDVFKDIMNRKESTKKRVELKTINREAHTVKDKIFYIKNLLIEKKTINFKDTFEDTATKAEKIITFIAILELIKSKSIKITQNNLFDEIIITSLY